MHIIVIPSSEVTTLDHESFDDAMETGSLIVQLLGSSRLFTRAKGSEIFGSFRDDIPVQTKDKATGINTTNGDVKESLGGDIVLGNGEGGQASNKGSEELHVN